MNAQTKIEPQTLLGALAAALPQLEAAKKNANNPHFKAKYADLGAVLDAIQPIAEHGLWFRQVSHEAENGVCIETLYIHDTGELSAGKVFVPADRANAQGYGSAQTYARRYGLQMAFGLATEDDDGNAASTRQQGGAVEGNNGGRALGPSGSTNRVNIDEAQWSLLVQLIKSTSTNAGKLCGAYNVSDLRELTVPQFEDAKKVLETRLAEQAKEKQDA